MWGGMTLWITIRIFRISKLISYICTMTDAQLVISVIFAVVFFVILIFNVVSYPNVKLYKKKYDELRRGVYKYQPTEHIESNYFYLYSYDITTLTFTRTDVNIIFFPDGDIKLTENNYIHKWQIWWSIPTWYYYRKLHKLKDELIVNYEAELDVRQIYNRAVELERKKNKLEFKFLRG